MTTTILIIATVLAAIYATFKTLKGNEKSYNLAKVPDSVKQWQSQVQKASKKYGVPFPLALSVLWVESAGNESARGSAGESGLMQLKQIAVNDLIQNGYDRNEFEDYEFNPDHNINAGVAFLSLQKKRAGNWNDAVKAYNQGYAGMKKNPELAAEYLQKVNNKKKFFS